MKLIDTHVHFYYEQFNHDRQEMLKRTWETCQAVICVGADLTTSRQSISIAQTDPRIFASVGIHPHESHQDPLQLSYLATQPQVVAIGECGIDLKPDLVHPQSSKDLTQQLRSLRAQVSLAKKMNLPLIIHCREGWSELIAEFRDLKPTSGVIHSWTGGLKEANLLVEMGFYLSFSGMITYPANNHIREVAKLAPLNRILLETDAPYLPPQPMRGQRNEPSYVKMAAEVLAEVRGVSLDEIAQASTENASRLFRLP